MVEYDSPDGLSTRRIEIGDLPSDWTMREIDTQQAGDAWLDGAAELLLIVPSVIVPIEIAPDRNVLINHRHPNAARIAVVAVVAFTLDPRLFKP
jgi:RES domain-containing protein